MKSSVESGSTDKIAAAWLLLIAVPVMLGLLGVSTFFFGAAVLLGGLMLVLALLGFAPKAPEPPFVDDDGNAINEDELLDAIFELEAREAHDLGRQPPASSSR